MLANKWREVLPEVSFDSVPSFLVRKGLLDEESRHKEPVDDRSHIVQIVLFWLNHPHYVLTFINANPH